VPLLLRRNASNAAAARAESSRGSRDDLGGVGRVTKTLRGSQVVLRRPSTWRCVPLCRGVERERMRRPLSGSRCIATLDLARHCAGARRQHSGVERGRLQRVRLVTRETTTGPEHEKRRRSTDTSHDGRGRFCACTQQRKAKMEPLPSWSGSSNGAPCSQIEAWAPAV
jgi:hypothetical protein